MASSGQPYITEQAATLARKSKNLEDTHEVVTVEGGFALKSKATSERPATKDKKAVVSKRVIGIPPDFAGELPEWSIVDVPTDKCREAYRRVKFHDKRHEYEQNRVRLCCNGEVLDIGRGKVVTLPGRFLEIARNATIQRFEQKPGEGRKVYTPIQEFPFDDLGPGKPDDYVEQRRQGTEQVKKEMAPIQA